MTSPTNLMTTADAKDRARAVTLRAMQLHDGGDNYRLFNAGWDAALEAPHGMTEATPAMIEAGKCEYHRTWQTADSDSKTEAAVTAIYTAMQAARPIDQQEAVRDAE